MQRDPKVPRLSYALTRTKIEKGLECLMSHSDFSDLVSSLSPSPHPIILDFNGFYSHSGSHS